MLLQVEDIVNPNMGWIVPPLAMATEPVAKAAAIDPSIPELFYGLAALIYAIAAFRKSTQNKSCESRSVSIFSRKIKAAPKALDGTDQETKI